MKIEGNIVDVIKNRIYPGVITLKDKKIVNIKKVDAVFDSYISPGFVDAHIHIESAMLCPSRFAETVAPFGTVATVSDPHEIANVLGMKGIEYMIKDAKQVPLKIFFTAPSCVPATNFETTGANLDAQVVGEILQKSEVVALGEMMNFPGLIAEDDAVVEKIKAAQKLNKVIDGHCPALSGDELEKYASFGVSTEHEASSVAEAKEKIEVGMKMMIRSGSSANQLEGLIDLVKGGYEDGMFVSDDRHGEDLQKGHVNLILKKAVQLGVDPLVAIKMVTLNPVRHYKLPIGLLQKGDSADFVVLENLCDFVVLKNYISGELVAEKGKALFSPKPFEISSGMNIRKKVAADFKIRSAKDSWVRVIGVEEGQIVSKALKSKLKAINGELLADTNKDVLKIANCSRYGNNNIGKGFVGGFGLKKGAIASSVAHDSHNIIVLGTTDQDMAEAVNQVIEMNGGLVVVDGEDIVKLELPIAGLMSANKVEQVVSDLKKLHQKTKQLACQLSSPFMTMSFMGLLVIPELKLSDQGLFDVRKFDFTDIII